MGELVADNLYPSSIYNVQKLGGAVVKFFETEKLKLKNGQFYISIIWSPGRLSCLRNMNSNPQSKRKKKKNI